MNKNYFMIILFFVFCDYSFSQDRNQNTRVPAKIPAGSPVQKILPAIQNPIADEPDSAKTVVFEKKPLPANQKVAPAIFYIIEDQPTDRMTYQQHIRQSNSKK